MDIAITDPVVIEQVRKSLPEVSAQKSGLYPNYKVGFMGEFISGTIGEGSGRGNAFLVITTNVQKNDTQFCFEVIDCNTYSDLKPIRILIKGYNPHQTISLSHFKYLSEESIPNILGGYVDDKLVILVPGFNRYDGAIVRSLDLSQKITFSLSFTASEPAWQSRYVAS